MNIINLDPNFTPYGQSTVDFQTFTFPSGCEPHIKIHNFNYHYSEEVMITHRIKNHNDFLLICLCVDALRRLTPNVKVNLFIPYLPFARQDRVMVEGEPLSIKVFANLLNSLNLNKVILYDPHSEVSSALINNCEVIHNYGFVRWTLNFFEEFSIVSPDAGAAKKIYQLAKHIGYTGNIIETSKKRDVVTGNITNIHCDITDFNKQNLVIIDDICDGGGTFVLLGKYLREHNCGKLFLLVSHGIFSKGLEELNSIFDGIFTTNSIAREDGLLGDYSSHYLSLSHTITDKELKRLNI